MITDPRAMDYHCFTCAATFNLDPDRAYLCFPLHCPDCETKMMDAIGLAFDATVMFTPTTAPEVHK